MERYHISKLGIAIIFYAIYFRRVIVVYGLATQQDSNGGGEYVYYQGVQGKPGVDFPVYARIPKTSFSCKKVESGYYADMETNCQVFHICNSGAKISFLCPNGTIFQQSDLICEWWFKVNCTNSPNYYTESVELLRQGSWQRKNYRKSQNRNSSSSRRNKPQYQTESNNNRRSDTNNRVNDEEPVENEDAKKQVDVGDRRGKKYKESYDNLSVPNELTENDYGNSEEAQIPQETASFYKNNNQNAIASSDKPTTGRYPNHKEIYTEITRPRYYSTKGVGTFSQTLPPQTYSTNRIPLNDGKPFVVLTPKSVFSIQADSFSSGSSGEYNRGTTESFRYSPTVPPFTSSKQSLTTTLKPKIIVDSGSESNGYAPSTGAIPTSVDDGDFGGSTPKSNFGHKTQYSTPNSIRIDSDRQISGSAPSTGAISILVGDEDFGGSTPKSNFGHKTQYSTPNSIRTDSGRRIIGGAPSTGAIPTLVGDGDFGGSTPKSNFGHITDYSTPNSIRTDSDRQITGGISFTERINTFSGLDDVIHTPTTKKFEASKQENDGHGAHITDSYSNQRFETTTKDSYYPSVVYATSAKYGTESGVGSSGNNLRPSPNIHEANTRENGYKYDVPVSTDHVTNNYESTTGQTSGIGTINVGVSQDVGSPSNNQFETSTNTAQVRYSTGQPNVSSSLNNNQNEYESSSKSNIPKQVPTDINGANSRERNEPPAVYDNGGGAGNLPFTSRNIDNQNVIPDVIPSNANVPNPNDNGQASTTFNTESETTESSYGDACGDDIVYTEVPQEQIVVGKQKIVIDDTTVPSTETNSIKLKINNVEDGSTIRTTTDIVKTSSANALGDSTIFRINVKYGQPTENTEKPNNGFYVTKQFQEHPQVSPAGFSNANTYLPKQTSTTENYNDVGTIHTKAHTYLPKNVTPSPFSLNGYNEDLLKLSNKQVLTESSGVPQTISTRKTSAGVSQISDDIQNKFALRPKPFELPPKEAETKNNEYLPKNGQAVNGAAIPDYRVSSARPFSLVNGDFSDTNTVVPTSATPYPSDDGKLTEHLKNMLQTLKEIINDRNSQVPNDTDSSARPGLIIPPSVGPQTLHTLAVYFANAVDGVDAENGKELPTLDETEAVKQLLTKMTQSGYHDLFKGGITAVPEEKASAITAVPEENTEQVNDLEGQHTKTPVTPRVRQLAQVFTKALSSYLDDPDTFKKVLEEARPTEPPSTESNGTSSDDDELLNYSDADIKPHLPRLSTTTTAPVPTWGYVLAPNNSNSYEYNSVIPDGEHLQSADSQSLASQFNNYIKQKHFGKGEAATQSTTPQNLPSDHWTVSDNATKLWHDKLYTNPRAINENLNVSGVVPVDSRESGSSESAEISTEIKYGISDLPRTDLNSTEVHKILVDIINSTKNEGNKLKRILSKLNTTQEDFLLKMKEIEQNPLTRRLILLLISECGSNITHLEGRAAALGSPSSGNSASLFESPRVPEQTKEIKGSSPFPVYVDPKLKDEDQDNRALQLLNSLYTIASKYGK